MNNLLKYTLCFPAGTFRGLDIANMIRRGVGFSPAKIYLYNIFRLEKAYEKKDLEVLDQEGVSLSLVLYQGEGGRKDRRKFAVAEVGHAGIDLTQVIYWVVAPEQVSEITVLDELLNHPDLTVAYCCDEEDEHFQSATHISHYQVRKKGYAHVSTYYDEFEAIEKIDISHNPGRKTLISGMWLMSCWRMWFGKGFFARVPAAQLLAFPYAHRAEQLPSGSVFVELYADPFAADTLENRTVQQAFRDWVGMEEMG